MFCPHCGHKIQVDDQKFCDNCGFDLSKVGKEQPTELKKMIDFALKDHQKKTSSPTEIQKLSKETQQPPPKEAEPVSSHPITEITPPIGKKDEWKWGWGWYILAGLVYTAMKKAYADYGTYDILLQLFAIVISLSAYYALRRKYLKRVQTLWRRSLYSGIVAFMVAALVTPFAALLVPTRDQRIAQQMIEAKQVLQSNLESFKAQDQELWSQFISEPNDEMEYRANLRIVESSIPIYHRKDSILMTVMARMHSNLKEIYEETTPHGWSLPYSPTDFRKFVDKAQDISRLDQLMLSNLSSYYKSLLSAQGDEEQYLQAYQDAHSQLNAAVQEYTELSNQLLNLNRDKKSIEQDSE